MYWKKGSRFFGAAAARGLVPLPVLFILLGVGRHIFRGLLYSHITHTDSQKCSGRTHTHRQQNNGYCRKYYWEKSRHPWRIRNFPATKNFQHIRLGTRFGL